MAYLRYIPVFAPRGHKKHGQNSQSMAGNWIWHQQKSMGGGGEIMQTYLYVDISEMFQLIMKILYFAILTQL
jgi:hypothetical protein